MTAQQQKEKSEKIEALKKEIDALGENISKSASSVISINDNKFDIVINNNITLNGITLDNVNRDMMVNFRQYIIAEEQMRQHNWLEKQSIAKATLAKLLLPVCDNEYNGSMEVCCPHCDHGTHIDDIVHVKIDSTVSCGHCGGEFYISKRIIDLAKGVDVLTALTTLETEIEDMKYTADDNSSLDEALEALKKLLTK